MANFKQICLLLIIAAAAAIDAKEILYTPQRLATHGNMAPVCYINSNGDAVECYNSGSSAKPYLRLFHVYLGTYQQNVLADIFIGVYPKYGDTQDSDFWALLSDTSVGIGFNVVDRKNYNRNEPCIHARGTPGSTLTNRKVWHYGPSIDDDNRYPQTYNFLISSSQQTGICFTATEDEGSYTNAGFYNASLAVGKQLYLDIYADNTGERYNFRYITLDIEFEP
ncbi:uncharacterized protein [Dysidea avara]|uniref:uncharacterized protein n=1 Tax=Dysidea avara TaxID=196820 RepID=UPI003317729E